jgi:hypothetical protein
MVAQCSAPHMAQTHFEKMVEDAIVKLKDEMVKLPPDAPVGRFVEAKGRIMGLTQSLDIFRHASRVDVTGEI